MDQPSTGSERLILRPLTLADAPDVHRMVGDRDIASTTLRIPHPYEDGMAEEWIGTHQVQCERGEQINFAIDLRADGSLVGNITLRINQTDQHGELGYWIGKPYWNMGYATEATQAVIWYGFEVLGLQRIFAGHFTRNPASGRVMQKAGMTYEGCLRKHHKKWDVFEDLAYYGIIRSAYDSRVQVTL